MKVPSSRHSDLMIVERCLQYLNDLPSLVGEEKRVLFRHMARNYGRTVRISQKD